MTGMVLVKNSFRSWMFVELKILDDFELLRIGMLHVRQGCLTYNT